jgi:hypothetical protein
MRAGRSRCPGGMPNSPRKVSLEAENAALRDLLAQAASDAERMLEQAGIGATENEAAKRLQRLLLEELHHRVMNTLATVMAITSQSLRSAENLKQGRLAVENRLVALGRAHDLLLRVNWDSAKLTEVIANRGRSRSDSAAHHVTQRARRQCAQIRGLVHQHRGGRGLVGDRRKRSEVQAEMDRKRRAGGAAADAARFWDAPHRSPRRPATRPCAIEI